MQFLSNGDFGFPFTWPLFWAKQFYTWSYQSGAMNIDGIMRMPSRLVDLLVFMVAGNLAFEYFFLFSSLLVTCWSFYYFCRVVLRLQNKFLSWLVAVFFACNPIVLGNISKIGLIVAASMLPLCFALLQQAFETKRLRFLLLWLVCLNISLIHPFTFLVNAVVSGIYFAYGVWAYRWFNWRSIGKVISVAGIAVLLNAYCLLPIVSLRTVDKGILSNTIAAAPTDYTALVDVLNTGTIFTGLSLSKNVVKDYDFYAGLYQSFYFVGVFAFYAVLIGLYIWCEKRLNFNDRRRLSLLLIVFLALVLLATVEFMHMDTVIKFLINLPGGWAFRSPLKWQLYIPLTLFGMLAILLSYIKLRKQRIAVIVVLCAASLLANGYLCKDIVAKLLTPRAVTYFSALQTLNMEHKNVLVVSSHDCDTFGQAHPAVMTELNQVLQSKNTQVKQVSIVNINQVDLSSYNYILACQEIMAAPLASSYNFTLVGSLVDDNFQLYANTAARPYIAATPTLFTFGSAQQIADNYQFVTKTLGKQFVYTAAAPAGSDATNVQDVYGTLSPSAISGQAITAQVSPSAGESRGFYAQTKGLYYSLHSSQLAIGAQKSPAATALPSGTKPLMLPASSGNLGIAYTDRNFTYDNLVTDPSFEAGPWQRTVGDCYNYDHHPAIAMGVDTKTKSDGRQSLVLEAARHVACTTTNTIPIQPGQHYLLSFEYQTAAQTSVAGYSIGYSNADENLPTLRLPATNGAWKEYTLDILAPDDVTSIAITLQTYPDALRQAAGITHYDNVQLIAIPDVHTKFYVVDYQAKQAAPRAVTYRPNDPTHTTVHIRGATTPFYLVTAETYSDEWQLSNVPSANHFIANDGFNGWYVDPAAVCKIQACRHDGNGYTFDLSMDFAPQRWFYAGATISAVTFVGIVIYLIYDTRRYRQQHKRSWNMR